MRFVLYCTQSFLPAKIHAQFERVGKLLNLVETESKLLNLVESQPLGTGEREMRLGRYGYDCAALHCIEYRSRAVVFMGIYMCSSSRLHRQTSACLISFI